MADGEPALKSASSDHTVTIRWSLIRNLCLLIVVLTGKQEPVEIFELLGNEADLSDAQPPGPGWDGVSEFAVK